MDGYILGVFGTSKELKSQFMGSVAKKSEVEGMIVYHRGEGGRRLSFLDDPQYPDKVQGYARIASLSDFAYYLYPGDGRLSAPDGELAVLIDSFRLPGVIEVIDGGVSAEDAQRSFKGMSLASFPVERRTKDSSILDMARVTASPLTLPSGLLIYIDRAFSVKGVGTVVLGFIISGTVSVHDKLRCIPAPDREVEVKGIQVSDEDQETAGRGVRVGLSLKGIDAKELDKTYWLDDGSFSLTQKISFDFASSGYYKQPIEGRELHIQLPGQTALGRISREGENYVAELPFLAPSWNEMRMAVVDLNGKNLRVAGGGTVR